MLAEEGFPPLASLLARCLDHTPAVPAPVELQACGFEEILEEETSAAAEAKARLEQAYAEAFPGTGMTVVLRLEVGAGGLRGVAFDPTNLLVLPDRGRLHLRLYRLVTRDACEVEVSGPSFEAREGDVITVKVERPSMSIRRLPDGRYKTVADGLRAVTRLEPEVAGRSP
jgi:hypothetical protein